MRIKTAQIAPVKAKLLHQQGGRCAICTKEIKLLSDACLDHDHDTGAIRGVLCRNCNGIEGKIKNLIRRGRRDMGYIEYGKQLLLYWFRHKTNITGLLHPTHLTDEEKAEKRRAAARKRYKEKKTK